VKQEVQEPAGGPSSSRTLPRQTPGSVKRKTAEAPNSPISRKRDTKREVKAESPEPELDEVCFSSLYLMVLTRQQMRLAADQKALCYFQVGCSWSSVLSWNGRKGGDGNAPT
jgi:hypothetical protein